MATFVLVHGSWQGGWCWKRVVFLLRRAGHEVFAPTLTGLGERAHLMSDAVDLDTHIADILGVLHCEELNDVILCGHSYGGMVISGVADKVCEKIRALVYLDAVVPEDGACLMDYLGKDEVKRFREGARQQGEGVRLAPLAAKDLKVNAGDCDWVDRQCVAHPIRSFEQRLKLTGAWGTVPKRVYVYAAGYAPSVFTPFYKRLARDPQWETVSMPCAHEMMIDMPERLAEILLEVA